ncbi:hypothetical protein HZA55_00765 [Candidatus Poribacteria bacterium]|nr:hypothetical protein [Candidatus Poribacteria bacterium]
MVERNLQIDKNISFSEDISMLEEIKRGSIPFVSAEAIETIVPEKKNKLLNFVLVILFVIVFFQLNYIIGKYIERNNALESKEKMVREKAFNEKLQALKTQSENFTRDAKNMITTINNVIKEVNEIKKDKSFIPDKFDYAKKMFESAEYYIKNGDYERASKMAINSINAGNITMTYAEAELESLRNKADQKAQEQEKLLEKIRIKRDETLMSINKAKDFLKRAAKKNPEKFAPITYGEAKRVLLDAVRIYNETVDSKDINEIDKALKLAKKSGNLAEASEDEAQKAADKYIEEIKLKEALKGAQKARELWEKSQKEKASK